MDKTRKRGILTVITMVGLAAVLALNPCNLLPGAGGTSGTKKRGDAMKPSLAYSDVESHRPPLDAAAPMRVETATFALG
jgi:hypothetical protein